MQFIFITWNHVLREANQVADALAKQAIMALNHFQVLRFLLHVLTLIFCIYFISPVIFVICFHLKK